MQRESVTYFKQMSFQYSKILYNYLLLHILIYAEEFWSLSIKHLKELDLGIEKLSGIIVVLCFNIPLKNLLFSKVSTKNVFFARVIFLK